MVLLQKLSDHQKRPTFKWNKILGVCFHVFNVLVFWKYPYQAAQQSAQHSNTFKGSITSGFLMMPHMLSEVFPTWMNWCWGRKPNYWPSKENYSLWHRSWLLFEPNHVRNISDYVHVVWAQMLKVLLSNHMTRPQFGLTSLFLISQGRAWLLF